MCGFASPPIWRGKATVESETHDCLSNNVHQVEENDSSEQASEDYSIDEEDRVVSCLPNCCTAQKMALSSVYSPVLTSLGYPHPLPSHSSCRRGVAESSFVNICHYFESSASWFTIASVSQARFGWNFPGLTILTHISVPHDASAEPIDSTPPAIRRRLSLSNPEGGQGLNASPACGFILCIHGVWSAASHAVIPSDRNNAPELGSCALPIGPWRDVMGQRMVWLVVVMEQRGYPAYSGEPGAAVRPSLWRTVKCGARAGKVGVLHPCGEDWSSSHELVGVTSQDDYRHAIPSQCITGTSGASLLEDGSSCQTSRRTTADILHSQISLGAFPPTNSPNCTVDRDSRQLSQLRFPQQRQGVNESSEKTAFEPVSSFDNISLVPQSEERRQRQSHGGGSVQWPQFTEHSRVPGTFRTFFKVFLNFSRLKGTPPEEALSLEELNELDAVPEEEASQHLWHQDAVQGRANIGLRRYHDYGEVECYFVSTVSRIDADLLDPQLKQFNFIGETGCFLKRDSRTETPYSYMSSQNRNWKGRISQDLVVVLVMCQARKIFFMSHSASASVKSSKLYGVTNFDLEDVTPAKSTLQEFPLHRSLRNISTSILKDFLKGKVDSGGTHYLKTGADRTGKLEQSHVTIILSESRVNCSTLTVCRAPAKCPLDFHGVQAVCSKRLRAMKRVGTYAKFCLSQGPRPTTQKIARSNLDGDLHRGCTPSEIRPNFQECGRQWDRTFSASENSRAKPIGFSHCGVAKASFDQLTEPRCDMTCMSGNVANSSPKRLDEHFHKSKYNSGTKGSNLKSALNLSSPHSHFLHAKTESKLHVTNEEWLGRKLHDIQEKLLPREGIGGKEIASDSASIPGNVLKKSVFTECKWCRPVYEQVEVKRRRQPGNYGLYLKSWFGRSLSRSEATERGMKGITVEIRSGRIRRKLPESQEDSLSRCLRVADGSGKGWARY